MQGNWLPPKEGERDKSEACERPEETPRPDRSSRDTKRTDAFYRETGMTRPPPKAPPLSPEVISKKRGPLDEMEKIQKAIDDLLDDVPSLRAMHGKTTAEQVRLLCGQFVLLMSTIEKRKLRVSNGNSNGEIGPRQV